jgi:solute:Na+ symporter, SSS family
MKEFVHGQPIDYIVLAGYFVFIILFGAYFARYTRSTKDFFNSGQRFSWWLVAISCISVVVGSYSFIKYSQRGYSDGLSSTMTYLDDWFLAPLFMLGWLPLIYYSRVVSIPEYFQKRFDRPTRIMAVIYIMTYLIVSIGFNLYTMGIALNPIIPRLSELQWAAIIGIITASYCSYGGQSSVIMTDLVQGILLLAAGFVLLFVGWYYLGEHNPEHLSGVVAFWQGLPPGHRLPFSGLNKPDDFPMAGVFWQDFFGSSMFFYFGNQGLIMRFQALKSVQEGRKAVIAVILVLMPMAAIAVASAGWIGRAMETYGLLPAGTQPAQVFTVVTEIITRPGVFGFILAALVAALMSTITALINGVAAIGVTDIYKPYIAPDRSDRHYLTVAKISSFGLAMISLVTVPLFQRVNNPYLAHAIFTAAISPPIIVTIILGITWKKFSARAALITMIAGAIIMLASFAYPHLMKPITDLHHMAANPKVYGYMRDLFGVLLSAAVAVAATFIWPNTAADEQRISGFWLGSLQTAKRLFKGSEPNDNDPGQDAILTLQAADELVKDDSGLIEKVVVTVCAQDAAIMSARSGDLVYVTDPRWWLGGLHSLHATLRVGPAPQGSIIIPLPAIQDAFLIPGHKVRIEKII